MLRVGLPEGEFIKDLLVIVQDLDNHENEILRALTDRDGNVPPIKVRSGLYRVIATNPYGLWQTSVREVLVRGKPTQVAITAKPMGTHGNGDVVLTGAQHELLRFIGPDGQPAAGASILCRDREATLSLERWYKADRSGEARIELVGNPTVVVVQYDDVLFATELSDRDKNPVIRLEEH